MTGGVHSISGSETLNSRFPGQWFQVESGLHYNWHRHYDPTIGRYTQPDPLGFVDGPSVYAYARNAPHEFVDPDGRFVPLIITIIAGIGGGLAYDYTISQIKSECGCGSSGSTAGPLGNAAVGAGTGLTGPYVEKPRTGIAGGGRSGNRTSVLSTLGGSKFRSIGRVASRGLLGIGLILAAKDAADIIACLARD